MKIINKILEIYHGWRNYIFRDYKVEKIAKERLKICSTCEFYKLYICTKCTCPGAGKARSLESQCPENKWKDGRSFIRSSFVPMGDFESSDHYLNSLKT